MNLFKNIKKLKRSIRTSNKIFLISHKNLDLDAIGSCIGMYDILKKLKKEVYIIIDDKIHETGVSKILHEIEESYNLIKSTEIEEYFHQKSRKNLLIILDTNNTEILQNNSILPLFKKKVIIDHHEVGNHTIKDGVLIIDDKFSSTSEMIVKICDFYDIILNAHTSTLLLAGITLDTNNFTLNTTKETFYSAYYLTTNGASNKKVQYLMKQNINDYIEQQKLLSNVDIINKNIAIAKGTPYAIYRKEDLARMADTILFFNDIDIAIVIGKLEKNIIGVSIRSLENSILPIIEKLDGGGTEKSGAAIIENKKISEIEEKIKRIIKEV